MKLIALLLMLSGAALFVWSLGDRSHAPAFIQKVCPLVDSSTVYRQQQEALIDEHVALLRDKGLWAEDRSGMEKFQRLGLYGWHRGTCKHDGKIVLCNFGAYSFSQTAYEKLLRGETDHDPCSTVEKSNESLMQLVRSPR